MQLATHSLPSVILDLNTINTQNHTIVISPHACLHNQERLVEFFAVHVAMNSGTMSVQRLEAFEPPSSVAMLTCTDNAQGWNETNDTGMIALNTYTCKHMLTVASTMHVQPRSMTRPLLTLCALPAPTGRR